MTPRVQVSAVSFDAAETATVTVTGSGFDPAAVTGARPPLAGKPAGAYVVFGKFAEVWQPSAGAASAARPGVSAGNGGTRWAVPADSVATVGGAAAGAVELGVDGSFTATLTVSKAAADAAAAGKVGAEGRYGIYTYPGSGAVAAAYETFTPVTFTSTPPPVDPEPEPEPADKPTLTITQRVVNTDGSVDFTVKGSHYTGAPSGVYVAVGPQVGSDWYTHAERFQASLWANPTATTSGPAIVPLAADGTFTAKFTGIKPVFVGGGVTYSASTTPFSVLTMAAHGSSDRSYDVVVPLSFEGSPTPPTTPPTPTVSTATVTGLDASGVTQPGDALTIAAGGFGAGAKGVRLELHSTPVVLASGLTADASGVVRASFTLPVGTPAGQHTLYLIGANHTASFPLTVVAATPICTARAVSGATLTWGVRGSFREYVTGPIAGGSITTSGVSGSGPWTWSGGRGSYNVADRLGGASYGGSVHFTGHNGALDLTISSPSIRVNGSTGTLTATVKTASGSSRVAIATLRLPAGSPSVSGAKATWRGVPATLTSAGAKAFAGFYQAGESLDPVTFTFPLGASVPCVQGSTLAATGSQDAPAAGAAAALVLVGAGLAFVARRRRADVLR